MVRGISLEKKKERVKEFLPQIVARTWYEEFVPEAILMMCFEKIHQNPELLDHEELVNAIYQYSAITDPAEADTIGMLSTRNGMELATETAEQMSAIISHSVSEKDSESICAACTRTGAIGGPFLFCGNDDSVYGGACTNCIYTGKAWDCEHRTEHLESAKAKDRGQSAEHQEDTDELEGMAQYDSA